MPIPRIAATLLLAIMAFAVFHQITSAQDIEAGNGNLWYDTDGNIVQAHGGNFLKKGRKWYLVGEDRSDPWHPDVNLYSSKDFRHWKFCGKIIQNGVTVPQLGKSRMIERPKLLYCEKTRKFIIWCHYESRDYSASEAAVFTSHKIDGPYQMVWSGRPLGIKSRDCNVFVDDDGKAYFISTIEENTSLGLFHLSDDYLRPLQCTVLMRGKRREAPAIAKSDGLYYMLSSACTGWEPNQCMLSTSSSLTEGWSQLTPVGDATAFDTQASSILTLSDGSHVYVGDRWKDPDLPSSKILFFPITLKDGTCTFHVR